MSTNTGSCDCSEPLPKTSVNLKSAVEFGTVTRPHISLNVTSVKESLPFYRALFNQRPTKLRDDYAKWECESPPINLSILEAPSEITKHGHFGIEVQTTEAVKEYHDRLRKLKVQIKAEEQQVACCYSVQNKIWAVDPDGNHWEVFTVLADETTDEGCGATCICYNPVTQGCEWT